MNEQRLLDALRERAATDAHAFREQHPDQAPNERWVDNSYTAALPLAKDAAGYDPGPGAHPALFDAYRTAIQQTLGVAIREDRERPSPQQKQMPTGGLD